MHSSQPGHSAPSVWSLRTLSIMYTQRSGSTLHLSDWCMLFVWLANLLIFAFLSDDLYQSIIPEWRNLVNLGFEPFQMDESGTYECWHQLIVVSKHDVDKSCKYECRNQILLDSKVTSDMNFGPMGWQTRPNLAMIVIHPPLIPPLPSFIPCHPSFGQMRAG